VDFCVHEHFEKNFNEALATIKRQKKEKAPEGAFLVLLTSL